MIVGDQPARPSRISVPAVSRPSWWGFGVGLREGLLVKAVLFPHIPELAVALAVGDYRALRVAEHLGFG